MAKTYFPLSVNPGADPSTLVGQLPTLSALRQSTIPQPGTGNVADTDAGIVPGGNLGRGAASGFQGALANIQAYGAAMADSMGFKDFADNARASALRRAEFAQSMAPTIGTTDQIHGFGDAANYAAGAIGGAFGSLAPTAVAGAMGGVPGAFMSLVPMSGGEVALRQYHAKAAGVPEAQNVAPRDTFLASTGQGLVQGALNLVPLTSLVGKGPLARLATRTTAGANPVDRLLQRAGTTALGEGAQESGEELTNQLAMQWLHGQPMGQNLNTGAIKEAGIAGMVGMAPLGGLHGVSGALQDAGGAGKVMGLRAAAEARRKAAEGAEAVRGSDTMANIKNIAGAYKDSLEAQGDLGEDDNIGAMADRHLQAAGDAAQVAGATVKKMAGDLATGAKEKVEGIMQTRRYDVLHDYASKLASEKDFIEGDITPKSIEEHGRDLIDMGHRLNRRNDLTPEDHQVLEHLLQNEKSPSLVAQTPELRRGVAQMFVRAIERDKATRAEKAVDMIGKKLAGTKKSMSATDGDPIGNLLVELGFQPWQSREQVLTADLEGMEASRQEPLTTEALLRGMPRPKTSQRGPVGGKPKQDTVTAQSEGAIAVWQMFDNEHRPVEQVDRVVRAFNKLIAHIAKGEADPDMSARAEAELLDLAATPEAKLRLREVFAKARELSSLDLSNKDNRKKFTSDMRSLVSGKRLPLTKALSQMAKRTLSEEDLGAYLTSYAEAERGFTGLTPEQQSARVMKLRSEIANRFGLENVAKAEAITRKLLGLDRRAEQSTTEVGTEQPERATFEEDEFFGEGVPLAEKGLDKQTMKFREPEEGDDVLSETEIEEAPVEFGGVTYDYERPFSGHKSFGSKNKAGERVSDIEAQRERYQMKVPGGSYFTVPVQERLAERFAMAVAKGLKPDSEKDAARFVKRVMQHSEQEAEQARSYLDGLKIKTDKLLKEARAEALDAKSRAPELIQLSKSRFNTEEFFKKAVGDEDAAYALNTLYWHDVRKKFAEEYPATTFFTTFPYRFPAFRSKEDTHSQKTDWAVKNHGLVAMPEDGAKSSRGQLAVKVLAPKGENQTGDETYDAVLSLPAYLQHKLHTEEHPVSKNAILTQLSELVNHLDQSKEVMLTPEAKKALGLEGGRMRADLLLATLPDGREIRGRDVSGIPHETPAFGVFSEGVHADTLSPRRLGKTALAYAQKNPDPTRVLIGDQVIDMPAEVRKAAAALGATEDNAMRLNIAQIANAVDKVLSAMEARFPDWDRTQVSPETVVFTKQKGKTVTMQDLAPFRIDLPALSREYAASPETDMSSFKTSERNMQDYADMLKHRLDNMAKGQGLEKTNVVRSLDGEQEMLRMLRRMKAQGKPVDDAIAVQEKNLLAATAKYAKWRAMELEKATGNNIDWAKVRLAESQSVQDFETEGVRPGQTMDPFYNIYGEESEAYTDAEPTKNYPRGADEVLGRWLGVTQRLNGLRFGEEDWMDAIPTKHDRVEFRGMVKETPQGKVVGAPLVGDRYIAQQNDKIHSALADEEPENVPYHNPLAPTSAAEAPQHALETTLNKRAVPGELGENRLGAQLSKAKSSVSQPRQALAASDAWLAEQQKTSAPEAAPSLGKVAENFSTDVDWAMAMAKDDKISAKKFAAALEERNLDPFVLDQISNKLGKGLRPNALRRALEGVLEKALANAPEVKESLSGVGKGSLTEDEADTKSKLPDEIRKENVRLFGKQAANVSFKNIDAAGQYDDNDVVVSLTANNMWSAAGHEYMHHLFKLLKASGGEGAKAIEVLIKNTTNPEMLAKARQLLVQGLSEKRAAALLERFDNDPEERVSYLYELRVAGLMDAFNPPAEGAIKRIFRWISSKLGFVPSEQQLANLMEAWTSGKLAGDFDNPSAIARAMGQEKRIALAYRSVEKTVKPLVEAVGNVFTPSYDRLLKMNNPGIKKIADAYGSLDTNAEGRMGIVNERDRKVRLMENEFSQALGVSTKAERDSAIQEVLNGNPQSELAQKIAAVMKQYTEDRVPLVLDRERVEENMAEFLQDVNITGESNPGAIRRALWGDASQEMFGNTPLPSFEFKNPAKRAKWQRQTAEEYLGGFIKQFAARETREAAFGKKAEKLKAMLDEAREHGMTDADEALVKQFVAGAEGWLGKDMHPQLRKLQGAAMTGLNLFHLPYSVLSAMVDPIYIGVRSASMQEAWNAYSLGIKSIFDTFTQKEGRLSGDAAKFAEDVGLIAQAGIAEPMGDFFSAMNLEGASKKINAQFFRWNLLQGWERAMFSASAMAAQRFLIRHAENANEHSAEYLKELGLKPEDITVRPDGHLAVFENDGLTKEQAARIQNAIYKFSHQSAARPTAMTNPIWMNDPHFALIAHMKRFIMAQSAGVLAWMDKQRETKNLYPLAIAALAVPIQLASGQVRNLFTGGRSMPDDFMSAFIQGASEAGLMGRWHFGYDVANSAYHNLGAGIGVDAIAGPAVQDFLGLMREFRSDKK